MTGAQYQVALLSDLRRMRGNAHLAVASLPLLRVAADGLRALADPQEQERRREMRERRRRHIQQVSGRNGGRRKPREGT